MTAMVARFVRRLSSIPFFSRAIAVMREVFSVQGNEVAFNQELVGQAGADEFGEKIGQNTYRIVVQSKKSYVFELSNGRERSVVMLVGKTISRIFFRDLPPKKILLPAECVINSGIMPRENRIFSVSNPSQVLAFIRGEIIWKENNKLIDASVEYFLSEASRMADSAIKLLTKIKDGSAQYPDAPADSDDALGHLVSSIPTFKEVLAKWQKGETVDEIDCARLVKVCQDIRASLRSERPFSRMSDPRSAFRGHDQFFTAMSEFFPDLPKIPDVMNGSPVIVLPEGLTVTKLPNCPCMVKWSDNTIRCTAGGLKLCLYNDSPKEMDPSRPDYCNFKGFFKERIRIQIGSKENPVFITFWVEAGEVDQFRKELQNKQQ
mgnify:CR=1 FL=1